MRKEGHSTRVSSFDHILIFSIYICKPPLWSSVSFDICLFFIKASVYFRNQSCNIFARGSSDSAYKSLFNLIILVWQPRITYREYHLWLPWINITVKGHAISQQSMHDQNLCLSIPIWKMPKGNWWRMAYDFSYSIHQHWFSGMQSFLSYFWFTHSCCLLCFL